jgi:hypothetical protein
MRVRAYIEDARWEFAVSLSPDCSPSQIVQGGLVRMIENHHSASTVHPNGDVLAARRRLGELAERVYAGGYRAGLLLCDSLDWAELDSLAGDGWPQAALEAISAAINGESAEDDPNVGTSLYRTGLRDALSNVWRGAQAGALQSSSQA